MLIGLDFDNTMVRYDPLFAEVAAERGLGDLADKRAVRDAARSRPDGEALWQEIQAEVYAARMDRAVPFEGLESFVAGARAAGHPLCVVSHKTVHARRDPCKRDLRALARDWLAAHGLEPDAGAFFEDTRDAKIARIRALMPAVFVDDLEEVLTHPDFPDGVGRLFFTPEGLSPPAGATAVRSWAEVGRAVLS